MAKIAFPCKPGSVGIGGNAKKNDNLAAEPLKVMSYELFVDAFPFGMIIRLSQLGLSNNANVSQPLFL
ncbi:MAG: hypothetical protein LUE99_09245, partial [Bacteroides sp.]|nr:hypothetical protein [Bacteroides sp.]